MMDVKNVELADSDTSQKEHSTTINKSGGVELTSALIEKSDDVPFKEVVDASQLINVVTKVHLKLMTK